MPPRCRENIREKKQHEIFSDLVGSDAPSLLDKSDNEKQVASMPPPDKKRKRLLEEDLLESKRSRDGGRGARSPIARLDNHY